MSPAPLNYGDGSTATYLWDAPEPEDSKHIDMGIVRNIQLKVDITDACNKACRENVSNTPDFILAEYIMAALDAFEKASIAREKWYGKSLSIGGN